MEQRSLLITIKSNGDIWINKDKLRIDQINSKAVSYVEDNPTIRAVILLEKDASSTYLVSVMDQLESAGIEKISMSSSTQ
ncbi:MAG: ExbD/TolR family protein [Marinicellaceae bacterium]